MKNAKYTKKQHYIEAEKFRDRIGDRLFNPRKVNSALRHFINDDIQRTKVILSIPFGEKVLDVGCSDGAVTIEIAKKWQCQEALGIDISSSAILEAKKRLKLLDKGLRNNIKFRRSFVEDLTYPGGYFDTVAICETLEHIGVGQLEIVLGNLVRMLKPHGNFITSVPNRFPHSKYVKENRARWNWPTHYRYFSYEYFESLLKEYFKSVRFYSLYDEKVGESIFLIANCWGKK